MDILNNKFNEKSVSKAQMEQVENQKQEYKLVGKYLRTKGLKLFSYNSLNDELKEFEIKTKDEIHLLPDENGKLMPIDLGLEEVEVDTRNIHFEALNIKNAEKRISKYKAGKIKELCNLRKYDPDSIKLF